MSLGDRITASHEHDTWKPAPGDRVRVGPVALPIHEWVGVFARWGADSRYCYVEHPSEGEQHVLTETLRGPAA